MKYWSKSNLKSKCRYGYKYGWSTSKASLMGCALHYLVAWYLEKKRMWQSDFDMVCDKFGVPEIFQEDLRNGLRQWRADIGNYIIENKVIISIETSEAEELAYSKPIARVKINDRYGLQGMLDLVCKSKKGNFYQVIDWKSGMLPDDPEFENICNGTLTKLYYGYDSVKSSIYSIATGMHKDFTVNNDNIDKCLKLIDDRVMSIEAAEAASDDPPKTANSFCFYCGCKATCDKYLGMINGTPVFQDTHTKLEIIHEINRLKAIEKAAKNEKEALETRCKTKMSDDVPVECGNYEYILKDSIRYKYDAQGIYGILGEFGCTDDELASIITISKKDLDKIMKNIKTRDGSKMFKTALEVVSSFKEESSRSQRIIHQLKNV